MASEAPIANFSCLDELAQVIHQGTERFVVLSTVSDVDNKWTVHLGLKGRAGRWWKGSWTDEDIHKLLGSKATDKIIESFAEKLAEGFIQGQLSVSDWSAEKGARIKLTLGPTFKKPLHINLTEMTPEEAAAHAAEMFFDIAYQASKSRKCQLYPSTTATEATCTPHVPRSKAGAGHTGDSGVKDTSSAHRHQGDHQANVDVSVNDKQQSKSLSSGRRTSSAVDREVKAAQEEIKASRSQQQTGKRTASPVERTAGPSRAHKGTSLANPNKKARKVEPIEFASDNE